MDWEPVGEWRAANLEGCTRFHDAGDFLEESIPLDGPKESKSSVVIQNWDDHEETTCTLSSGTPLAIRFTYLTAQHQHPPGPKAKKTHTKSNSSLSNGNLSKLPHEPN